MKASHVKACEAIVRASEPWKRLQERVDFRAAIRKNGATRAFVCTTGAVIAGFILFIPEPVFARGGYLRAIGVAPEYLRQGIGRRLLLFAEHLTARHCQNMFLCVSSFNRAGQSFYRNLGYERVGKLPGLIRPEFSEYIYCKRLDGET
jgi:ribosomal protein S18 acetylase RimI-like enzyme